MAEILEELQFTKPVLLVGPADLHFELLGELARRDFPIIAADGGANRLLKNGIVPDAIIGDMDSLDQSLLPDPATRLVQCNEQNSTDFEKCLNNVSAPLFVAFGFTGKRFDHTLATLHGMVKFYQRKNILLVGSQDISLIQTGEFSIALEKGQTISIFPLSNIKFSGSHGLKYPLEGLELDIGKKIGTSNSSNAEKIVIIPSPQYEKTRYVVTLPISSLGKLLKRS
ncbi:MAG: thiamine diphosphokinase [Rhizobiaceae bacterium]|nr:thiamine diphosphokinase [Rhizobiaceae bacterium]